MTLEELENEEKNERVKQPIKNSLLEYHLQSAIYQSTIQEKGAPTEERKKVMELLFEALQKELFLWEKFSIELPRSVIDEQGLFVSSSQLFQDNLHMDELHDVAIGPDGRQKKLPSECLQQIKEKGRFEVESNQFSGKKHIWQLSPLVIRGFLNLRDDCFEALAFAYSQICISPINRIISEVSPSVWDGIKFMGKAMKDLVKGTVGVPEMQPKNFHFNLSMAQLEYILGDFYGDFEKAIDRYRNREKEYQNNFNNEYNDNYDNAKKLAQLWNEIGVLHRDRISKDGNIHIGGIDLDFLDWRLFDPMICRTASDIVRVEVAKLNQNWNRSNKEFIDSIVDDLPAGLSPLDVQKFVFKKSERHCRHLVFLRLLSAFERSYLGRSMGITVVKYFIVQKQVEKINKKWAKIHENFKQKIRKEIIEKHPIRQNNREFSIEFHRRRLREEYQIGASDDLDLFILHRKYDQLIDFLEKNNEFDFTREIYLLGRERSWATDEKFRAIEKFSNVREPVRVYCWQKIIWRPSDWIITRKGEGYEVQMRTEHKVTSSTYFWRIKNIFVRSQVWFSNNIYRFYQNTINGTYGVKAIYKLDKFRPRSQFDYSSGQIVPTYHEVMPVMYRIKSVFNAISKSRSRFEATPDNGFLGKDLSRIFNLFWNYILVLPFGLLFAGGIFPGMCGVSIITSLLLLLTTILTAPIAAIIKYLITVLIFDEETCNRSSPRYFPLFNTILLNFLIKGIGQIIAGVATSIAVHPLVAIVAFLFAIVRYSILRSYDWLIYHLVVKRKAKIPISNTFVAKRIAGPGLNREFFYQISPDSAMISLMIHLEHLELNLFEAETIYQLNEPNRQYYHLVNQMIGSLASANHFGPISANIEKFLAILRRQLKSRREKLPNYNQLPIGQIRQRPDEFNETIDRANRFVIDFFRVNIFQRIYNNNDAKIDSFWRSTPVHRGEWGELTNYYLSSIFGAMFLQPLSEDDTTLELQIDRASKISNFMHMIKHNEIHDDLDIHRVRLINRSTQLAKEFVLQVPTLEVSAGFTRLDSAFPTLEQLELYRADR